MTQLLPPQEKAKELVEKFASPLDVLKINIHSKRCALIAVDDIIDLLTFDLGHDATARELREYYTQVKTEIEKL